MLKSGIVLSVPTAEIILVDFSKQAMVEDEPFHADVNACCACCSSLRDSCYQGPIGSTQWFCTWTLTEEFAEAFQRLSSTVDVYNSLKH